MRVLRHGRFFHARETDALLRARERYLGRLKSRLEDTMFHDYPHLSNDWLRLYYGDHADIAKLERWQGVDVAALLDDLRGAGAIDEEQEHMNPLDLLDDLYGAGEVDEETLEEYSL